MEITESELVLMKWIKKKGTHGGDDAGVIKLMAEGLAERFGFRWRLTEKGEGILREREDGKDDREK